MRALEARNFFNQPEPGIMPGLLILRPWITKTCNQVNVYGFRRQGSELLAIIRRRLRQLRL